jgi:hypothetical protein
MAHRPKGNQWPDQTSHPQELLPLTRQTAGATESQKRRRIRFTGPDREILETLTDRDRQG